VDLQGWIDEAAHFLYFDEAVKRFAASKAPVVIEVGSWKGLSTAKMADHLKRLGYANAVVVAIDTWLGSPEHVRSDLIGPRVRGVPQLYTQFLSNMRYFGLHDVVYPFPISSVQGGHFLKAEGFEADMVYVDAGHEQEAVALDIVVFWRLVVPGGCMILDDYKWPGVAKAVHEFVDANPGEIDAFDITGNVSRIRKKM
jgi:predicted O-methyltransferase YrrM